MAIDRPPLSQQPWGLLDFFGVKTGGRYPQSLGEQVTPMMDLTEMYAVPRSDSVFSTSSVAATQAQTSIAITATSPIDICTNLELRVPAAETWLVLNASILWSFSAAANQFGSFHIVATGGGVGQHILPMGDVLGFTTSDAGVVRGASRALMRPVWLPANAEIRVAHSGVVCSAAVSWNFSLRVARYRM